ncbi:hypothetical protein [Novosphingobium sp. KA1]|uniref:hypothetical protein n=1 Tax=Novosphingobium sp. (strain KA1) TaxID=164608 RepID=UPI001A8DD271|nr:hypothetical protein [Novosphingobium sp. KA1]
MLVELPGTVPAIDRETDNQVGLEVDENRRCNTRRAKLQQTYNTRTPLVPPSLHIPPKRMPHAARPVVAGIKACDLKQNEKLLLSQFNLTNGD